MKNFGFESLSRKLEEVTGENDDGADVTNIDITVIANSDGEAAEEAVESHEEGEAEAQAQSLDEAADESNDAQETVETMQAIIRQYGLNPGMVAMMSALVPWHQLGIRLPSTESLDAYGSNESEARELLIALEATNDSFWEKTKNAIRKVWQWIKDMCIKFASRVGTLRSRIERMNEVLKKRMFDSNRNDKKKIKFYKFMMPGADGKFNSDTNNTITACGTIFNNLKAISAKCLDTKDFVDGGSVTENNGKKNVSSHIANIFKNAMTDDIIKKAIGHKVENRDDAAEKSLSLKEDDTKFYDTDTVDATSTLFDSIRGEYYKVAIDTCEVIKSVGDAGKRIKSDSSRMEKAVANRAKNSDDAQAKIDVEVARVNLKVSTICSRIATKVVKTLKCAANGYLIAARGILSCTKASDSNATYEK